MSMSLVIGEWEGRLFNLADAAAERFGDGHKTIVCLDPAGDTRGVIGKIPEEVARDANNSNLGRVDQVILADGWAYTPERRRVALRALAEYLNFWDWDPVSGLELRTDTDVFHDAILRARVDNALAASVDEASELLEAHAAGWTDTHNTRNGVIDEYA